MCCSDLQCVVVCGSVLMCVLHGAVKCVAVTCSDLHVLQSVLQCVVIRCNAMPRDAVCCGVMQCVAVCCTDLQYDAMCVSKCVSI